MGKGIMVNYQGKEIAATICEQQIWFSYSDISKIIDIETFELYPDESANINVEDNFVKMINEFCVYRLLCLTNTQEARNFRKWLVCNAIIRLRKYGYYKLSVAEQKEQLMSEIIELKGNDLDADKLKYFSLDKLKLEKSLLEKTILRFEKEKETKRKIREISKDFPYAKEDFEAVYDIDLAVTNLRWCNKDLGEYMIWIGNECYLNKKFIQYLEDNDYKW